MFSDGSSARSLAASRFILVASLLILLAAAVAQGEILRRGKVQLLCHRTANRDLPENTLDSLALAARMGCDLIEVDVTRTLDGQLVLNHDNFLDRLTNSTGEVEHTDLRELDLLDFGAWRGLRFRGMRIAHFDDALRLARQLNVSLYLDIKSKGIGPEVLTVVAREGMTERVMFGGEWDDIRSIRPNANQDPAAYLEPGLTQQQVDQLHAEGKAVVANFLSNGHETDLAGMRAAVEAGVDAIWVDYPRIGAEAVGRPVELTIARLAKAAEAGPSGARVAAVRELAHFTGFPLRSHFFHWLMDADGQVSHEAALALVTSRPQPRLAEFEQALHAPNSSSRRNAAWAIGALAPSEDPAAAISLLSPMLDDNDKEVVKEALLALTWCDPTAPAPVPASRLLPLLSDPTPIIRGLAAIALARYQPQAAAIAIPAQLEKEEADAAAYDSAWAKRGRAKLTQSEIDALIERYRAQMKLIQALSMLPGHQGFDQLAEQAFRPVHNYSNVMALVAGYQLWDRLAENPEPAIRALSSSDHEVADRAEWAILEAGPAVLEAVRIALPASSGEVRQRLIRILAWLADQQAIPLLHQLEQTDPSDTALIDWAIAKIESMQ